MKEKEEMEFHCNLFKSSKGLSVVIGYVLLITFAAIISVFVYGFMKTYVPTEKFECQDGVSLYLEKVDCSKVGSKYNLDITLRNNGRFDIGAYYISATTNPGQEIATLNLKDFYSGNTIRGAILFGAANENTLSVNKQRESSFENINPEIYSLTITPARFVRKGNAIDFIICNDNKIKQDITCS